jgi:hypothetical protein
MQWHIYRKWNERLFMEMSKAYREGRAEVDPAEFWYKGEIGYEWLELDATWATFLFWANLQHFIICRFFDYYILPLAKKLKGG